MDIHENTITDSPDGYREGMDGHDFKAGRERNFKGLRFVELNPGSVHTIQLGHIKGRAKPSKIQLI